MDVSDGDRNRNRGKDNYKRDVKDRCNREKREEDMRDRLINK